MAATPASSLALDDQAEPPVRRRGTRRGWVLTATAGLAAGVATGLMGFGGAIGGPILGLAAGAVAAWAAPAWGPLFGLAAGGFATVGCVLVLGVWAWQAGDRHFLDDLPMQAGGMALMPYVPALLAAGTVTLIVARSRQRAGRTAVPGPRGVNCGACDPGERAAPFPSDRLRAVVTINGVRLRTSLRTNCNFFIFAIETLSL